MSARPRVKRPHRTAPTKALTRGVALSVAVGNIACAGPAEPPAAVPTAPAATATAAASAPPPAVTAEPAPAAPDPSPALAAYTVTNASFVRRTLYTWTTPEQIDELVRTRTLLSRTESPRRGRSFYDRVMEQRWMGGDRLASLLRAPAFQKARFAWPAAWATLLGWPGESYGAELVEVTLKEDAWIAMYRTATRTWEVRDMNGNTVSVDDVLRQPERLGAVHFVHDDVRPPGTTVSTFRRSSPDGREAYREYVLCNEAAIASWSVGTESIAAQLRAGADAVEAAAKYFEARPPPAQRADRWNAHVALLVWPGLVALSAPKELYEAALAFPNPNYVVDPEALKKLAATMRALPQRATSTTHRPSTPFPGAKPVPLPPPPPPIPPPKKRPRPWRGTY